MKDDERSPFERSAMSEEEVGVEKSLRPTRLDEFIGQRPIVENFRIAISGAQGRGEVLDHVLLSGMPGLGKTTLSNLIASELGVDLHTTSGPAVEKGRDLLGILSGLKRGDVIFIDEVHRLSKEAEEYLYSAMEDYKVDLVLSAGADARCLRINVAQFTLIGATTREGMLSAPFRSRFGIVEKLEPYPASDLVEIIRRSARILDCEIPDEAAWLLAERCRGTPRYANRFLRRIRDVAQYRAAAAGPGPIRLGLESVKEGLVRLGVDQHGLDKVDRRILEILLDADEPVGVKTIAVSVGEEERTIEDVHEPYLIQRGMLVKTSRGRRASSRAFELYRPGSRLPLG
jgi:Holliday junction DNA helicase RuvB